MAKGDETPRTNPAEIENLIEQIRGTNLDPRAKEKVERLLRTVLTLVELLQRKNTSIKKLREMIFGKRTERHQARKAEGQEKASESEKSDDGQPKAASDQDVVTNGHRRDRLPQKRHLGHSCQTVNLKRICNFPDHAWLQN